MDFQDSLAKLERYIISEDYKGYDPYDTLNSWIPFRILGKWSPVLATQFQKRNPVNIRHLLGIKKEHNPKAMGLFLQAYSILYGKTKNEEYLIKAKYFYNWLIKNYSIGYSGICWGYNFPWASPNKYMKSFIPSAVVTGFVIKGIFEYYKISKDSSVNDIVSSAVKFIANDLEWTTSDAGICISYTPLKRDICYNASLLGAEVLAIHYAINNNEQSKSQAISAVEYVVSKQKSEGVWAYSVDNDTGKERMQIDFHQGYVIESIFNIMNITEYEDQSWRDSIAIGLSYYRDNQFAENGRSYWRIPKMYPVEIHNEAQGIITFIKLESYDPKYRLFAEIIAQWSIDNMQDNNGYFYYQTFKTHTNKISYMRWSQAWMFLAISNLI